MTNPAILKRSRLCAWIVGAVVCVGAIAITRGVWGAERVVPGPHEITLVSFGKDYAAGPRTRITISGPYDDRAACKEALKGLRVIVTGMKPGCFPVEQWRVN